MELSKLDFPWLEEPGPGPGINSIYLQLLIFAYKQLLNKPYENEVTLTGQKPPLKCCQPLEIF